MQDFINKVSNNSFIDASNYKKIIIDDNLHLNTFFKNYENKNISSSVILTKDSSFSLIYFDSIDDNIIYFCKFKDSFNKFTMIPGFFITNKNWDFIIYVNIKRFYLKESNLIISYDENSDLNVKNINKILLFNTCLEPISRINFHKGYAVSTADYINEKEEEIVFYLDNFDINLDNISIENLCYYFDLGELPNEKIFMGKVSNYNNKISDLSFVNYIYSYYK